MEIRRLNMDNSWYINWEGVRFLIDPWLMGREVDYFPWFNTQWHRTPPVAPAAVPEFDFVLITQKYPDHFHRETLDVLKPARVIGPGSIFKELKKILPHAELISFDHLKENLFGTGIDLHFLPTSRKIDPIYDALVLDNGRESIFVSTHGYPLSGEQLAWVQQRPPVALLFTPLNKYQLPFWLGGTVSPGLEAARHLAKALSPRCVVATHDEDKWAKGLVQRFARVLRAPDPDTLSRIPEFTGRYRHIDHYSPVVL
jgi:L-ascorbate metabolism protein UlaG (beta-lactamase superfamily)